MTTHLTIEIPGQIMPVRWVFGDNPRVWRRCAEDLRQGRTLSGGDAIDAAALLDAYADAVDVVYQLQGRKP